MKEFKRESIRRKTKKKKERKENIWNPLLEEKKKQVRIVWDKKCKLTN